MNANRIALRPSTVGPCNASPVHRSLRRSASNRPNARGGARPGGWSAPAGRNGAAASARPATRRVRAQDHRDLRRGPLRASRFNATASSSTSAGVRGATRRGAGTSASNPPRRQSRIHRSSVARDTRTGSPNGPGAPAGQRADQPAPLLGRQRRVGGLPDQRVPEQPTVRARSAAPVVRHGRTPSLPPRLGECTRAAGALISQAAQGRARVDQLRRAGASRQPALTAAASCHGDTRPAAPSRRRAAAAPAPITSTASANTLGWLAAGRISGPARTSNA